MKRKAFFLSIFILSQIPLCLSAQQGYNNDNGKPLAQDTVDLQHIPLMTRFSTTVPTHTHAGFTPFTMVRVLDNRFDTTVLYNRGIWPSRPKGYTLGHSTATAVQQYLEREMVSMKKTGNKTLLLNITQFSLAQAPFPYLENSTALVATRDRNCLRFTAEAYYQTGKDSWRKIVSIHYFTFVNAAHPVLEIRWLLGRALDAAGSMGGPLAFQPRGTRATRGTRGEQNYFGCSYDTTEFSLAAINTPAITRWKQYPIQADRQMVTGYYQTFADFRDACLVKYTPHMCFNEKDSTYCISSWTLNQSPPWAVTEGGRLFLLLDSSRYLELTPSGGTFCFRIPYSIYYSYAFPGSPAGEYSPGWGQGVSFDGVNGNVGSIFLGIAAYLVFVATADFIDTKIHNAHVAHVANHPPVKRLGPDYAFRTCYINMDTGSIIF